MALYISELSVDGLKSFRVAEAVDLRPGVNCIIGENGQGKSNLLEAILFALGTRDPRAGRNLDMIYKEGEGGFTRATTGLVLSKAHQH